jgi:NAD(P)-dependent dehydrogenase (short-subunit alcohol dehydrogenase family)
MAFAVVTGTNRGIGLALVKALVGRGFQVLAACRKSSPALAKTGAEIAEGVDVATDAGIAALKAAVGERSLDLVIHNAGILRWNESLIEVKREGMLEQFTVNAVAPVLLTQALLPQLSKGAKVALITSRMGSVSDNTSGGHYGYRMSKAALNIAGMSLARDLASREIAVAILHPGMVSTDMIGGRGQIEPDEAARGLLARIDGLTLETSGTFWHQNGEVLPW